MSLPSEAELERLQSELGLREFVRAIVAAITGAEVNCSCTMELLDSENKFVQLAAGADGDICGEVVSNRYLSKDERWTTAASQVLEALGWVPPLPATVILADDSPSLNYRRDWRGVIGEERDAAVVELAEMLTATLSLVMGVSSATELAVAVSLGD